MRVKLSDYATFKEECDLLMQLHFLEILAPRGYHFRLHDALFSSLGDNLRIIVVSDDESAPIGYAMTIVSDDIFDDSRITCQTAAIYIQPEHRKGVAGLKLLQCVEADLSDYCPGARWRVAAPLDVGRDIGKVFERQGLAPIETLYQKTLEGDGE